MERCSATTTTITTATTTTTTTTIRKEWILIFRQKDCAWRDPDGGDVGKTDSDDCFARFNEMKNHKKDGKFRFKLLYPRDEDANELIFEQDTNPLDVEPGNYVVPGFKIISTGDDDVSKWTYAHRRPPAFSGLLRYGKDDNAVLVASSGYWYALGSPLKCFPGNQFTRDNGFTCTESRGAWNADWASYTRPPLPTALVCLDDTLPHTLQHTTRAPVSVCVSTAVACAAKLTCTMLLQFGLMGRDCQRRDAFIDRPNCGSRMKHNIKTSL